MRGNPENNPERRSAGVRINKYLADIGVATRRKADELIAGGKVTVNGRLAAIGDRVREGDIVRAAEAPGRFTYLAYAKPKGVVTANPGPNERAIADLLPPRFRDLFPVGRLDKNSEGLILLTDDGRVTERLLNPARGREREYVAETKRKISPNLKRRLEEGVFVQGDLLRAKSVELLGPHSFRIVLTEGKRHEVKRMAEALRTSIFSLKRVRIENIELNNLPAGQFRLVEGKELRKFLETLGLK